MTDKIPIADCSTQNSLLSLHLKMRGVYLEKLTIFKTKTLEMAVQNTPFQGLFIFIP
ncbi:MAG: hypothetical protein K5787_11465 [Lentisphaeria bacterium]|nr:hypothetical protein [Lentisphaeria bacterium]